MAERHARSIWEGTLREGSGTMKFGAFEGPYSFSSRFDEGQGFNPEELIGAAHAGCYSMALSGALVKEGFNPERIETGARVTLGTVDGKARITNIHLETIAKVPGISEEKFLELAEATKTGCPVSAALAATNITLDAKLIS